MCLTPFYYYDVVETIFSSYLSMNMTFIQSYTLMYVYKKYMKTPPRAVTKTPLSVCFPVLPEFFYFFI